MRRTIAMLATLAATGCYSVVTVNIGSVNKQAGSVGRQLPPEVLCAALASPGQKLSQLQIEALQNCAQSAQQQKAK